MDAEPVDILLIEDDPGDVDLFQEMLSIKHEKEFNLKWVDRLKLGLAQLAQHPYDAVLLDLSLPDSTGLDTFIRVNDEAPNIPIVVLSGLQAEKIALQAVKAGAQDYLVKDEVNADLLVRALRYAIWRKKAEADLRQSEERYALASRGANDGLWDWDIKTDEIYFSPRWKSMLGFDNEEEMGSSPNEWFNRVHPEDRQYLKTEIEAHLAGLTPHFENEYRIFHQDGTYRWVLCRGLAIRDDSQQVYRMAGSQTDITRRKMAEEQLIHDALHDALTHLANRNLFVNHLRHSIELSKRREDYLFAVLFLDLDRFKVINDSLGHIVGDQLLISVAQKVQDSVRPGDTVARIGGDDFVILLDDVVSRDEAFDVAKNIQTVLSEPINLNGQEVVTTASIGIVMNKGETFNSVYNQPEDFLRDADTAMYQAKARGLSQIEIFDLGMRAKAVALLRLETQLRQAIENQQMQIHYQPIISLATGKITGVETLVRWQHPDLGLVAPAEFIPLAEETGLIIPLGEWVLHTICAQANAWRQAGHTSLRTTINISIRQFYGQDLPVLIGKILSELNLDPAALELEVTEGIAMQNVDFDLITLKKLNSMGIQLAIDDFGTGYSSLSRLRQLPIQTLKIDQSFIREIPHNTDDSTIVKAMIAMAHSLNLKVIAEGVETPQQLAFLQKQKCDEVQGHLFCKAVPVQVINELLETDFRYVVSEHADH